MKLLHLCIIILISWQFGLAQNLRPYSDGPLSYADFEGKVLEVDSLSGMIYFDHQYRDTIQTVNGISIKSRLIDLHVNTKQSWLNFDANPDNTLDYFQALFDIEYLYNEQYNALVLSDPLNIDEQEISNLLSNKNITLDKYKLESSGGLRPDITTKWKARIKEDISSVEIKDPIIDLIPTYGFDGHFGMGYNLLDGNLKEYYGNSLGLAMGLNFNLKHFYLALSGNLGVGRTKKEKTTFPLWTEDIHQNTVLCNIGVGKRLRINRFYFSPFIGPSLINVYVPKTDFEDTFPETSDTKWKIGGGFFFDIPFSNKYGYVQGSYNNVHTQHGLRLSFHLVPELTLFDNYTGAGKTIALSYFFYLGDVVSVK